MQVGNLKTNIKMALDRYESKRPDEKKRCLKNKKKAELNSKSELFQESNSSYFLYADFCFDKSLS